MRVRLDRVIHRRESGRLEEVPTFTAAATSWPGGAFELLVLELSLPDGQGPELLGRALELVAGVPVVVLSGHAQPVLAAQMIDLGARGDVVKDLDAAEQLRDLVAQFTSIIRDGQYAVRERMTR